MSEERTLDADWVAIAILGKARGNHGEVTAVSLSSKPERFGSLERVFLAGRDHPFSIEEVWEHNGALIFKFAGVDSISDAELLRGLEVRVPLAERAPLDPGEFYNSDLIGCEVVDVTSGQVLGKVAALVDGGGPGLLELDNGTLIPFAKDFCVSIDIERHRIAVKIPSGLLELNLPDSKTAVTFHIVTIFPDFFRSFLEFGVVARAKNSGIFEIAIHNLRDWTHDRHKTVDDRPFGGGEGMLLKPDPLFNAVETILPARNSANRVILLSAHGARFDQESARRLAGYDEVLFLCGRYEGVDERVAEHLADEELSIGDYVLSGGELGAAVVLDAVARLAPGVLGNEDSAVFESFSNAGLLDCPQYTRPAEFRGWKVPDTLLSGNHEQIKRWRQAAALEKTTRLRPDLLLP